MSDLCHSSLCLQLIDRATSPRDEDDAKGDSWKELSLLKVTPPRQPQSPAALSQPVSPLSPLSSAPGEQHPFPLLCEWAPIS
jgi:hypothetical protein